MDFGTIFSLFFAGLAPLCLYFSSDLSFGVGGFPCLVVIVICWASVLTHGCCVVVEKLCFFL